MNHRQRVKVGTNRGSSCPLWAGSHLRTQPAALPVLHWGCSASAQDTPLRPSSAAGLPTSHLGQAPPARHSSAPCQGLWSRLPGPLGSHTRVHSTLPGSSERQRLHPTESDLQGLPSPGAGTLREGTAAAEGHSVTPGTVMGLY